MSPTRLPALTAVLALATAGCDAGPADGRGTDPDPPAADSVTAASGDAPADRPDRRRDTLRVEGMAEPVELSLFEAPAPFPLPFTAYVPAGLEAETDEGSVRFVAAFGGSPAPDAFVHLFVFPAGADRQHALAAARGYKTGRGVPVSQGLEPIAAATAPPHLAWAMEAYTFRYQSGGRWYAGTIGVGRHDGRFFQVVRHYPVEYGDGFPPRADLVLETWRWADGSRLDAGPG